MIPTYLLQVRTLTDCQSFPTCIALFKAGRKKKERKGGKYKKENRGEEETEKRRVKGDR
jgi:hypothetical protein